jgi:hypothetical protein
MTPRERHEIAMRIAVLLAAAAGGAPPASVPS